MYGYWWIYVIENKLNGKKYIGFTENYKKRWKEHQKEANNVKKKKFSQYIHKSMNFHGIENFTFSLLDAFYSKKEALKGEIFYIKKFDTKNCEIGYNLTIGGDGIHGVIVSDETKKKL